MPLSTGKAISAGAAGGAMAGGAGVLGVFQLVNLKDILTNSGPPIAMLDGLAIFSLLALFAVFAYARAVQAQGSGGSNQTVAVLVFSAVVLFAVGALFIVTIKENRLQLTANFRNHDKVLRFPFVPEPAVPPMTVNATINDGTPHDFDDKGNLALSFDRATNNITVDVDGLRELENIYGQYENLLAKQTLVLQSCSSEAFTGKLTTLCATTLRNIFQPGSIGGPTNEP